MLGPQQTRLLHLCAPARPVNIFSKSRQKKKNGNKGTKRPPSPHLSPLGASRNWEFWFGREESTPSRRPLTQPPSQHRPPSNPNLGSQGALPTPRPCQPTLPSLIQPQTRPKRRRATPQGLTGHAALPSCLGHLLPHPQAWGFSLPSRHSPPSGALALGHWRSGASSQLSLNGSPLTFVVGASSGPIGSCRLHLVPASPLSNSALPRPLQAHHSLSAPGSGPPACCLARPGPASLSWSRPSCGGASHTVVTLMTSSRLPPCGFRCS